MPRIYRKTYIVFKIGGSAVATITFQPTDAVSYCFVLSQGEEPEIVYVDKIEQETLLAFGCVEELTPSGDGKNVARLDHIMWDPLVENLLCSKFIIEG